MIGTRRAAVVGLGLIGGSIARELAALGVEVQGADADPASLREAVAQGVLTRALGAELEGVEEADLVVLAVPVTEASAVLARLAPRLAPGAVVTDAGSTKRSVAAAAERLGLDGRFVGSHPLAGDHRAGWAAGREGLFRGALVYLCPTARSEPDALERVHALWRALGAEPRVIDADAHDRLLAWSSHLPQLASTALALALAGGGVPRAALGPGGRDVTRLAASSPEVWAPIALDNADHLEPALAALAGELESLRAALAARDPAALHAALRGGGEWSTGG